MCFTLNTLVGILLVLFILTGVTVKIVEIYYRYIFTSADSKIFGPTSPWTIGFLSLIVAFNLGASRLSRHRNNPGETLHFPIILFSFLWVRIVGTWFISNHEINPKKLNPKDSLFEGVLFRLILAILSIKRQRTLVMRPVILALILLLIIGGGHIIVINLSIQEEMSSFWFRIIILFIRVIQSLLLILLVRYHAFSKSKSQHNKSSKGRS